MTHFFSLESLKEAWQKEYKKKGIPSSFRKEPSRVLLEFISWLRAQGKDTKGHALDIGCGQGRNSFYLASIGYNVIGIELLEENARMINEEALAKQIPLYVYSQDAAANWPIEEASLDIAIDIFCYKHIVDKEKQKKYRTSLSKTLKPQGFYFVSLACETDGYYGPLLETSSDKANKLIIDLQGNIPSYLYSKESLIIEFSDVFDLIKIYEQDSISPMHGKKYSRKVINAIFKKRLSH